MAVVAGHLDDVVHQDLAQRGLGLGPPRHPGRCVQGELGDGGVAGGSGVAVEVQHAADVGVDAPGEVVALRLGPGLGVGLRGRLWVTCTLKLLVQPLVAYAIAHWLLGLTGGPLLAIVIIAALPTAQNVFIYATRYDTATSLARDTGLITTIGSVPVILAATLLLA